MKGILFPSEIISKINSGAPMKRQYSMDVFNLPLTESLEKLSSANSKVLRSWQMSVHTAKSSCPSDWSNEGQNIEKCDLLSSSGLSQESDLDLEAVEVRTSVH